LSRVGGCVHNSQLIGDSLDESEQICQQRSRVGRRGGGNKGEREMGGKLLPPLLDERYALWILTLTTLTSVVLGE